MSPSLEGVPPALVRAVAANSTLRLNLHPGATGLRPSVVHDQGWVTGAGAAHDFLVCSRLRRGDAEMGVSSAGYASAETADLLLRVDDSENRGEFHPLPASASMIMSVQEVLERRRSVRDYDGGSVSLRTLAAVLRSASGMVGPPDASRKHLTEPPRRYAPSGGGLYPISLHVCVLGVDDLGRGVYLVDPRRDGLWGSADSAAVESVLDALARPGEVIAERQAAAVCLLIARPARSIRKYGPKGVRNVLIEAGVVAERLTLAATALGVASVHCASFYDDEVHETLRIDGVHELLVHSVFLGTRADA